MLCFCILKRIGIATLFSQLWILNNFEKKSSKKVEKFLIFEKISKSKNLKNFENLENVYENFPLKIVLKIENFENFEILDFRFSIRFSMEIFRKYFRDFQNF